jgi:predicted Rossmann fold flavoprotein
MQKHYQTIILGAGASGLMCAASLPKKSTLLIDINKGIGAKIAISGGGKCNVTNENLSSENYLGNRYFIEDVLREFSNDDMLDWLHAKGLQLTIKKENQYFCKQSAQELLDVFQKEIDLQNIMLAVEVQDVSLVDNCFEIMTNNGEFKCDYLVLALGGMSYKKIGASDVGYKIATKFGHSLRMTSPALVGLTLQKEHSFMKELSGTSIEKVRIYVENKSFEGALLFTHKGISGPAVLNASLYWSKGEMSIDFLCSFSFEAQSDKILSSILPFPKRVAKAFLEYLKIEDKPYKQLSKEQKIKLESLRTYRFSPAGNFGYERAEVTRGGVETKEIDAKSMMSKKQSNLYIIGELLDVTGELGGYNLQWAFSSGYVCAKSLCAKIS